MSTSTSTYALRVRTRRLARIANESVRVTNFRSMAREGRDPLTGALVRCIDTGDVPPVHPSGAFHAYPFGMPDVP